MLSLALNCPFKQPRIDKLALPLREHNGRVDPVGLGF